GMSSLGLVALEEDSRDDFGKRSEYSEDIAARIDREVHDIIAAAHQRATTIIADNRHLMDFLVDTLIDQETIEGEAFRQLVATYSHREKQVLVA
ncbi:MAG: hypothetical protein RLZZ568_1329, partial [Cyanobacteriota bacterium]